MSIKIITPIGILCRSKYVLSGSKKKNIKYAITRGIKMCCSSFKKMNMANSPNTETKNLTVGSVRSLFISLNY
jgi:hypothetical protein